MPDIHTETPVKNWTCEYIVPIPKYDNIVQDNGEFYVELTWECGKMVNDELYPIFNYTYRIPITDAMADDIISGMRDDINKFTLGFNRG